MTGLGWPNHPHGWFGHHMIEKKKIEAFWPLAATPMGHGVVRPLPRAKTLELLSLLLLFFFAMGWSNPRLVKRVAEFFKFLIFLIKF
jgi:hypothetical protein